MDIFANKMNGIFPNGYNAIKKLGVQINDDEANQVSNSKAQAIRYKERCLAEQRWKCPTCNKCYASNNCLQYHISKKLCEKPPTVDTKQKITCVCGCLVVKGNINRHMLTRKHLDRLPKFVN